MPEPLLRTEKLTRHFTIGNAFKTYDWKGATRLVDGLMAQYDLPGKAPQTKSGVRMAE